MSPPRAAVPLLGLLFLAHAPHGPKVLLLDEPEVSLSPMVVRAVLGAVDAALPEDRQVLLTTHSPYVIQWGIDNDAEVRQVRHDFGSRTWRECLQQQGIDPQTFHGPGKLINVTECCALLETYLTG
jgi:predicted ATPase